MKTKCEILAMFAASSLLLAGCATGHQGTQWEYKITPAPALPTTGQWTVEEHWKDREAWLNELGKDGWALVSKDDRGVYYFKRPKR